MNRRHFLATTAAAHLSLHAMASPSRLKMGQIGTDHAHASGKMNSIRALPDRWQVVGLVEQDKTASKPESAYQGIPRLSEEALLQQADLHAVAVETKIETSCQTAMRCLKAGKHVHLDKPGALDHDEFCAMRRFAEQEKLIVQMGYMLRYNPAFTLLFQAIQEGWLGEITEIEASMGKLADAGTRLKIGALAGGGFFELACHLVDVVVKLLGKPTSVHPFSTPSQADGVQDNQTAVLLYPKAVAVLRCNHADPFGGPRRRFQVTGTQGHLDITPLESGKVNLSLTRSAGSYRKGTQSLSLEVPKDRYIAEFVDLADAIEHQRPLSWNAEHDIIVHETLLRASGVWH